METYWALFVDSRASADPNRMLTAPFARAKLLQGRFLVSSLVVTNVTNVTVRNRKKIYTHLNICMYIYTHNMV